MKQIAIFLHGKGERPEWEKYDPIRKIADKLGAELIQITANIPHRDGTKWFSVNGFDHSTVNFEELETSEIQIVDIVSKIITERGLDWNNIIWIGHSMGATMALRIAMKHGAAKVIAIAPVILAPVHSNFTVDWIEGGKDDIVPQAEKESFKILHDLNIPVNHIVSPNSTHDHFELDDYINSLESI